MPLIIAVLLGLSGLAIVIYPLLGFDREATDTLTTGPTAEVAEREWSARDALREVEFDHRLGNLDDTDYQALRSRYERRALAALKTRYQREQELDALIEQQLDALRSHATPTAGEDNVSSDAPSAYQADSTQRGHGRNTAAHNGARPATGSQARRQRGRRL